MKEILERFDLLIGRYPFLNTVLISVFILGFYYLARFIFNSNIEKKRDLSVAEKTLYKKKVGQYLFYILAVCYLLIWVSQLQVFFVSLLAVAAANDIAHKELIMCVTGGTLIKIGNIFKTGDRIEIYGTRGFVIEKNLLTTKILEIGPEKNSQQTTGDIITIPNSLMLAKTLKNESYFKGYSIKSFLFKVPEISSFNLYEKGLLLEAENIAKNYEEEAKIEISRFCAREGILIPSVNPRTKIILDDKGEVSLLVKLPVKNSQVGEIEQELNRCYLGLRRQIDDNTAVSKEPESIQARAAQPLDEDSD
jgi:small-conductance mechanosensitive channel